MRAHREFIVLGGVGAIGRMVVRDLFGTHRQNRILIADYNEAAARAYARSFRSRRVRSCFANARDIPGLTRVLRGHCLVVNCTQHAFNLNVMQAALAAKAHYLDLGGLFTWTRRQLKLDRQFRKAGLTAILGVGCSPGITNVMTRAAMEKLARADSIKIRVGCRDLNDSAGEFLFPYSAETIVEEMTLAPWIFERGRFRQTNPRTGWERIRFPQPVGAQWTVRTRHSEIATLPVSYRSKGVRQCDFKVSFSREFVRELMTRLRGGWTTRDLARLTVPRNKPNDYEVARVTVAGGRRAIVVDCHARANRALQSSAGDIDTGCPPSIVAQMIATGMITARGVWAPERVVPVEAFFRELRKRGMKIVLQEVSS